MTLTVVIGSSGSGKTTFLTDVHESHQCTYIRQYHTARPYIAVSKIPNFDPTRLPFWNIYEREGTAATIQIGGTMAGRFTAGLSGGQRKLLLFELVVQRTARQRDLLIVLDEPFAGVTDDFVPFIIERLHEMRQKHNILLVTNDHVGALTKMADNTIKVSAVDRSTVLINNHAKVDREKAILALSVGDQYRHKASSGDLRFFYDVEICNDGTLKGVVFFIIFVFSLYLASFWNSDRESAALVMVAGGMLSWFCINPYLVALVDWRVCISEEAEALMHASKTTNKALKTILTLSLLLFISLLRFGVTNAVIDGMESVRFFVAMLFDTASLIFPGICVGLFTNLPVQTAQVLSSMFFLCMMFFSTTFSPGAGLAVLKELRYIFARFYFWCMIESVQDEMENCPDRFTLLYLVLAACLVLVLFLVVVGLGRLLQTRASQKRTAQENLLKDDDFGNLQAQLYGRRDSSLEATHHSSASSKQTRHADV